MATKNQSRVIGSIVVIVLVVAGISYQAMSLFDTGTATVTNNAPSQANSGPQKMAQQPQQQKQKIIRKQDPVQRSVAVTAEDLRGEIVARSPNNKEASQHAELALSLRNQEMLTERAQQQAAQTQAEFERLKTEEQIKKLQADDVQQLENFDIQTGDGQQVAARSAPGQRPQMNPEQIDEQIKMREREIIPLEDYRVKGIFKKGGEWIARITRGGSIERVKSGYVLDGEIDVEVTAESVTFTRNDKVVTAYL